MKLLSICFVSAVACLGQIDYLLHANENILIHAPQNPNLNDRLFRVQADGFVTLPTVGRMRVGGVTISTLEKQLAKTIANGTARVSPVKISVVTIRDESRR